MQELLLKSRLCWQVNFYSVWPEPSALPQLANVTDNNAVPSQCAEQHL